MSDVISGNGDLENRCGSCARFVRVVETIDASGQVRRVGDCLLGAWASPLNERNTCAHYVKRGTVGKAPAPAAKRASRLTQTSAAPAAVRLPLSIPEELMNMNADEFRAVLREVLQEELGLSETTLAGRWDGGELIIKSGKEGVAEKHVSLETFFHKIVMVRDKLRLLEQKVNSHPKLSPEDKVQMQQYVTQCYGTLTTFNVLFGQRADMFIGQKGDRDD